MAGVCRIGDSHGCGATDTGGSGNVFVNGRGVHRIGDSHSHGSTQTGGSGSVFANGKGVARMGDNDSVCPIPDPRHPPSPQASASDNVFAG